MTIHSSHKTAKTSGSANSPFSYFKFLLRDKYIGSITPSSRYLVAKLVSAMNIGEAQTVIEYGPAQGILTKKILEALPARARLIAIERNQDFYEILRRYITDTRFRPIQGDVRKIDQIASDLGISQADAVVSCIPFALLTRDECEDLLKKTSRLLKPGGRFVLFQYSPQMFPILKKHFSRFKTEFVLRNIPPAFVFTAFK